MLLTPYFLSATPSRQNGNNIHRVPTHTEEALGLSKCVRMEAAKDEKKRSTRLLAPFNPTCDQAAQVVITKLFELQSTDVLFDIGCGDGRLLIQAAAQTGARCVGIEIDQGFVERSVTTIKQLAHPIRQAVDIRQGDILNGVQRRACPDIGESCRALTLLDDCTVLYLYLLPQGLIQVLELLNAILRHRRQTAEPGAVLLRVVTYMFQMRCWEAKKIDRSTKGGAPLYYYELRA